MRKSNVDYQKLYLRKWRLEVHSRKWRLVLIVILLSTLGVLIPPLISSWVFQSVRPLIIISGSEYVSLVTLVVSAYFGVNVWQKHIEGKQNELVEVETDVGDKDKEEGEGEA